MSTNTLFNPLSFFAYIADIPVPASSSNDDPEIQILQKQRKRKRQEEKWQTHVKKANRQKGLEYVGRKYKEDGTYDKVLKPARKIGTRCSCKRATKEKVCVAVSEEDRNEVFTYVWSLSDEEKRVFVKSMVDCVKPVEKKQGNSRRSLTMKYFLKVGGVKERVCKTFFLATTGLTNWFVHNVATGGGEGDGERRCAGGSGKRRVKGETEKAMCLRQFLLDLPKMPSHYCRQSSSKLYLEPIFQSFQEVFKLYQKRAQDVGAKALSRFRFMEEFNCMNLSLFQPRKDRCDECIKFEEGNLSEEEYNAHRMKAKRAQEEKARDKVRAGNEQGVKCVTMDLQSVLLCPRLNASALYYKTKLYVHNFTVYDLVSKHCVCYVWNECEGGLTGNEFASCVVDFLTSDLSSNEYVVYSDGCGYQNRNATLASALSYFSQNFGKTVTQNILEKGHTQMEVDSVHSTIERKLKNRPIHCPADYVSIMRERAGRTPSHMMSSI